MVATARGAGAVRDRRNASRAVRADVDRSGNQFEFLSATRRAAVFEMGGGRASGIRFSVKMPKAITHEKRLLDCDELVCAFLDQVQGLGERLGCILIQLPPSFEYDASLAGAFFEMFRALYYGPLALEPRHPSWFTCDAAGLLINYDVARVAADPARVPETAAPGGTPDLAYFRLHGSPRIYWSRYEDGFLDDLASRIIDTLQHAKAVWCIFDNTASGSATPNALGLVERLREIATG